MKLIVELNQNNAVTEQAEVLNATIDAWIENILQKELKTSQNVYQYEGRLLMKFKDLLERMGSSQIPLTDGFKDVTRDYLEVWNGHNTDLADIKGNDISAFNAMAKASGVAEVQIP